MSSTSAKPFRRITSLVKLRSRQETPYQAWEDQDELDGDATPQAVVKDSTQSLTQSVVEFPAMSPSEPNGGGIPKLTSELEQSLVECFYIGSTDMTGQEIRGRGCIDSPAAIIWEQSQDRKPKRKNSWSMKHRHDSTPSSLRPRYVRLATGPHTLLVRDNSTDELVTEFSYRKISFVGTHPKYTRLFAFIAESVSVPFCHAFKCEDKECAKQAACTLSDVFTRKIQELLKSKKIEVTATTEATHLH